MKKFVKILSLVAVFSCALLLVACNNVSLTVPTEKTAQKSGTQAKTNEPTQKGTDAPTTAHVHSFEGEWVKDENGHHKVCTCGETNQEAHNYGEWIEDQAATLEAAGAKHRVCSVCGYEEQAVIPQIGTLTTPVIALDNVFGEAYVTEETLDENALKYQYRVASKDGEFGDWTDFDETFAVEWQTKVQVKAIAKEGYIDSAESNVLERIWTNKVSDHAFMGLLDERQQNSTIKVTFNPDTKVNHVEVAANAPDWASVFANISGATEGYVVKTTVTNVSNIEVTSGQGVKLMFKWENVEDNVKWSNYMLLDKNLDGKGNVKYKDYWHGAQSNLTYVPIGITWNGVTPQAFSFDLTIEFIKISTTEEVKYDAEQNKVVKTVKYMDSNYKADVVTSYDVETKTVAELLAMDSKSDLFFMQKDKKNNENYYTKKVYLVEAYASELKNDDYGNGWVVDPAGNIATIYGMSSLNSGAFAYTFDDTGYTVGVFANKKDYKTIDPAIELGQKVKLLVQVEFYRGTTFEALCEYVGPCTGEGTNITALGEALTPTIVANDKFTATLDKAKYVFNSEAVLTVNMTDPSFAVKSVVVKRHSGQSVTLTAEQDGTYKFNVGTKDQITVNVESVFDATVSLYTATGEEGLSLTAGKLYFKVSFKNKEGKTLEVPADTYLPVQEKTIAEYDALTVDATKNEADKHPYLIKAVITEYNIGNGTLVMTDESGVAHSIILYGLCNAGTWKYTYDGYVLCSGESGYNASAAKDITVGDQYELLAYFTNYLGKKELTCELVKKLDAYTGAACITETKGENVETVEYKKVVEENEVQVTLSQVCAGDVIRVYATAIEKYNAIVKINGTVVEAQEGKNYVEFTAKLLDKVEITAEKAGYETAKWEVVTIEDKQYFAFVARKSADNEDESAPEIKLMGEKYLVTANTISQALEMTETSKQLYLVEGYAVEVQDTNFGNFFLLDKENNVALMIYGSYMADGNFNTKGKGFTLKENPTETDYMSKWTTASFFKITGSTAITEGQYVKMLVIYTVYNTTKEAMGLILSVDETKQLTGITSTPELVVSGKADDDTTTSMTIKNAVAEGYAYKTEVELEINVVEGYEIVSIQVVRQYGTKETLKAVEGAYKFKVGIEDKVTLTIKKTASAEPPKVQGDSLVLDFTSFAADDPSVSGYTGTNKYIRGGFSVDVTAFNNNSKGWKFIKCGRSKDASTASILIEECLDKAIANVVINFDSYTKNIDKVKTAQLIIASDKDFTKDVQTINFTIASGDVTINVTNPGQNLYYKIVIDMDATGANGSIVLKTVTFNVKKD